MTTITAITYFSNNVAVRCRISLSRALTLMGHPSAYIPPDAGLVEVRSPNRVFLAPQEIVFNINLAFVPRPPQVTRRGVYERDRGTCGYCGRWLPIASATLDHIVPVSQGGEARWENLVTCCRRCNQKKGGRTPEQAHMQLLHRPHTPKVRLHPD